LYCPVPSVTAVRVFSISAGLATSTVAPGRTAPDASLTIPAIALCARAMPGTTSTHTTVSARHLTSVRINLPFHLVIRGASPPRTPFAVARGAPRSPLRSGERPVWRLRPA
jgi:hypothetical protein